MSVGNLTALFQANKEVRLAACRSTYSIERWQEDKKCFEQVDLVIADNQLTMRGSGSVSLSQLQEIANAGDTSFNVKFEGLPPILLRAQTSMRRSEIVSVLTTMSDYAKPNALIEEAQHRIEDYERRNCTLINDIYHVLRKFVVLRSRL